MKICLGKEIEDVKKKDSETEKNLLKNRNSDELNELDEDDIYFHSNTITNIKIGSNTVNRVYLNNSIVYELQDTIIATKFHTLVPAATATSIIFDKLENKDVSGYNLVGYCDANNHIAVYNNNTEYLILNIRNAFNYAPFICYRFFYNYKVLINCVFHNFNTANVTNMGSMFYNCIQLTSLDLTPLSTANVTNMQNMFTVCSALTSLDLSSFNTANVTNMGNMFQQCRSLTRLDLSSFDTQNVTNINQCFENCVALVELNITFSCINLSNIYQAFFNCYKLVGTLDFSHCNFIDNISLQATFGSCSFIEKIILPSNLNRSGSMYWTFKDCNRLTTIIANTIVTSSVKIFVGCLSLVGGNGTTYNSSHTDAEYARVDGENGLPGYFTAPPAKKKINKK